MPDEQTRMVDVPVIGGGLAGPWPAHGRPCRRVIPATPTSTGGRARSFPARANPLERHLRDVLCSRIHIPQPDAAYLAAGRAALLQENQQ